MAEHQAVHRHTLETTAVRGKFVAERLGQILAFLVAITAIAGGIWLISQDKDTQGLAAIVCALGALVGTFAVSKYQGGQGTEREARGACLRADVAAVRQPGCPVALLD